jgi:hypothetical protein
VYWRIILKRVLNKQNVRVWNGFRSLRMGSSAVNGTENSDSVKDGELLVWLNEY